MPPMQMDEHLSFAHLQDVQGTTFGLYTFSH